MKKESGEYNPYVHVALVFAAIVIMCIGACVFKFYLDKAMGTNVVSTTTKTVNLQVTDKRKVSSYVYKGAMITSYYITVDTDIYTNEGDTEIYSNGIIYNSVKIGDDITCDITTATLGNGNKEYNVSIHDDDDIDNE